ncbi:M48 family metallopeptidase [Uliginosibacterium sp. sgz301328]|uniref:M48 family metallopeptidase n=1 Tax=Uliginosibacterium sp. sgz301328 TaxID=3243764 RepID=UPI00359E148A
MTATQLTTVFLLLLTLSVVLRAWLNRRHASHVQAHRDRVPAAFSADIPLDAHQRAADYTVAKAGVGLIDLALGTIWLLVLTLGGGLQAAHDLLAHWFDPAGLVHGVLLFGLIGAIGFIYDLPLTLFRTFRLEARFGFNHTTLRLFAADIAKQTLLAIIIGAPLLWVVLWLMARAGNLWWVWTWAFWLAVNLAAMVIYPIFIAPLFNKFEPLRDESLKARVEALLARCGFRAKGLFVMDGSKRSAHGNAYFTGFGAGKRIVFFDTLLNALAPTEIEAVLAHELGHFKRRHLIKRLAVLAVGSFAFMALLGYLIEQPWFYEGLGVSAQSNALALMLFSLVLPVVLFPFSPLASMWSRKHEFEADSYAKQHANAADLVSALVKLYRDNASTLTPDPLHSLFYDSHPPAAIRIAHLQR